MQHFTFLSLLLSAALILAVPLPLIRQNHQYHESNRVPVLKSGNVLITSRFHFFLGSGDGANGYSRLDLHETRYPSRIGEFNTTYNNYPGRRQKLGTFAIYPPKELIDVNPMPDVVANIPDNYNTPAVAEEYTGGYQKIVRK
ncbi:hypothetical protein BGX38DRAFT_1145359 [Terfezia claveryi]|nr:hypothetical protein BGX38DRAFT_1145359 [Terfezia claveryi]